MGLFRRGNAETANAASADDGSAEARVSNAKTAYGTSESGSAASTQDSEKLGQEAFQNNPWVNTKKRHFDLYESMASSVSQWRSAAFMMMIFLAFSVAGNIYLSQSVKVQPYIVQVDRQGYALPVKLADAAGVDQRVIASQVGLFIVNSRTRVEDRKAQLAFAENSYRSVAAGSRAANRLNDYYRSAPPTQARYPVRVEVQAIIPFTSHTYQATWREISEEPSRRGRHESYGGLFTVAVSPPDNFANLNTNPLGVYITDYEIRQDSGMN